MSIIKTGLKLATGAGSTALSFLGGIKTYLIIAAVTGLVAGSAGWYAGLTHEAKIMAKAATQAAEIARKSQSEKDSKDWEAAKADYEARLHIAQGANEALAALVAKGPKTITRPGKCPVIAPESMRSLNDPKLVGDTQ